MGECCICLLSQCGPRISTYPWPAEDLVTCVSRQTGFSAGAIERPTVVQNPLFPLGLLAFIVVGGTVAWKLYNSPIVRITGLWTLGALGVYWFATSGGMYNIIRGIPFSTVRDGKKVYWMDVSHDSCRDGIVMCGLSSKPPHAVITRMSDSKRLSWADARYTVATCSVYSPESYKSLLCG
jgi:hypothetical protein